MIILNYKNAIVFVRSLVLDISILGISFCMDMVQDISVVYMAMVLVFGTFIYREKDDGLYMLTKVGSEKTCGVFHNVFVHYTTIIRNVCCLHFFVGGYMVRIWGVSIFRY